MDSHVNERVKSTVLEGLGQRKIMFVPMVCISSFMLVGYAALDREAPEILATSITMDLSKAQELGDIDYSKIEVVDNRDSSDAIKIYANTDLVNFDQPGNYKVTLSAVDSFNNESEPVSVTLTLVDDEKPVIEAKVDKEDGSFYTNDSTYYVRYNSSNDIKTYINAFDNDKSSGIEGDVTDYITAENSLDTTVVGEKFVTVNVKDNTGNETRKAIPIVIFDDVAPVIDLLQGSEATVNYGSEFNIRDFVNAYDEYDGDLNDYVTIEGDDIDTSKLGEEYNIVVKVSDHSGNSYQSELKLVVADIEKPTITFSNNSFTAKVGDVINVADYTTVTDNYDKDIASKVVYSSLSIDTSTAGDRSIRVSAVDTAGNVAEAVFTVEVIDPAIYSGSQVAALAHTKVGNPYVYGGAGPYGFDCSGFTQWLYAQVGVSIPRTATAQYYAGTSVSSSDLQPGDLLFYNTFGGISHVGVYIGDGMMIHAGTSDTGVVYANINGSYWTSRYLGARRYN